MSAFDIETQLYPIRVAIAQHFGEAPPAPPVPPRPPTNNPAEGNTTFPSTKTVQLPPKSTPVSGPPKSTPAQNPPRATPGPTSKPEQGVAQHVASFFGADDARVTEVPVQDMPEDDGEEPRLTEQDMERARADMLRYFAEELE